MPVDLDLGDLSFDSPNSAPIITAAAAQADPVEGVISGPVPLDVELGWDALATPTAEVPSTLPVTTSPVSVQRASLPTAPQIAAESEMIEFDLGSLSLDLDRSMPANEMPAPLPSLHGSNTDPLKRKWHWHRNSNRSAIRMARGPWSKKWSLMPVVRSRPRLSASSPSWAEADMPPRSRAHLP